MDRNESMDQIRGGSRGTEHAVQQAAGLVPADAEYVQRAEVAQEW